MIREKKFVKFVFGGETESGRENGPPPIIPIYILKKSQYRPSEILKIDPPKNVYPGSSYNANKIKNKNKNV